MAWRTAHSIGNEAFLFFSIGTVSYLISQLIYKQLLLFRDANLIPPPENRPDLILKEAEDSVKVPSLETLIREHTSYEVKKAAITLAVERFLRDPHAYDLLLQDAVSKDVHRQESAVRALCYLASDERFFEASAAIKTTTRKKLQAQKTFTALVTCLCNSLPLRSLQHTEGVDHTSFPRSSQAEAGVLGLLYYLLPLDMTTALRAGLVSRWLKNYPLGEAPIRGIQAILRGEVGDASTRLIGIVRLLHSSPEGKRAMRAAGLVGSSMGEEADESLGFHQIFGRCVGLNSDGICYVTNDILKDLPLGVQEYLRLATIRSDQPSAEGVTLIDPDNPEAMALINQDMAATEAGSTDGYHLRAARSWRLAAYSQILRVRQSQRTQSDPEEAALRRQRREAMVFHEGESPVSGNDIFQQRITGEAPYPETQPLVNPWVNVIEQRTQALSGNPREFETALTTARREFEAATRPRNELASVVPASDEAATRARDGLAREDPGVGESAAHPAARDVRWVDIMRAMGIRSLRERGGDV